jgi:nitrous oxide reductase accessory protein NosL
MKYFKIFIFFLLFSLLFAGCEKKEVANYISKDGKPVVFKLGATIDPECGMDVKRMKNASEVILKGGKTIIFDDPGCMIKWLHKNNFDPKNVTMWTFANDTHKWINAKKAKYDMTDNTPMHYGFGAYETKKDTSKKLIDFKQMRLRMLRGENLTNPKIRKKLLGH